MARLTRADLKKQQAQRRTKVIDVPEWGGDVEIAAMTGTARDSYEADLINSRVARGAKEQRLNLQNIRARLVARCMINADGSYTYDYTNPGDIDELGSMDSAGLDRVFKECQVLNGITDEDVDALTKNSRAEANGVSGSN